MDLLEECLDKYNFIKKFNLFVELIIIAVEVFTFKLAAPVIAFPKSETVIPLSPESVTLLTVTVIALLATFTPSTYALTVALFSPVAPSFGVIYV